MRRRRRRRRQRRARRFAWHPVISTSSSACGHVTGDGGGGGPVGRKGIPRRDRRIFARANWGVGYTKTATATTSRYDHYGGGDDTTLYAARNFVLHCRAAACGCDGGLVGGGPVDDLAAAAFRRLTHATGGGRARPGDGLCIGIIYIYVRPKNVHLFPPVGPACPKIGK